MHGQRTNRVLNTETFYLEKNARLALIAGRALVMLEPSGKVSRHLVPVTTEFAVAEEDHLHILLSE